MAAKRNSPEECPVCGAEVPRGARACPECGADERTGWNEENTRYDGLDLPDEAFEDDDTPKHPRPKRRVGPGPTGVPLFWWCVGVVLLIALLSFVWRMRL